MRLSKKGMIKMLCKAKPNDLGPWQLANLDHYKLAQLVYILCAIEPWTRVRD